MKSAILLSGLYAHGTTWFKEPTLSRDHTERMLHALGVPLRTVGTMIELDPAGWDGKLPAFDIEHPRRRLRGGVPARRRAASIAGSRVTVRGVGANPTRTGLFEIARHMGAGLEVVPQGEQGGEPIAEITAWHQALRGTIDRRRGRPARHRRDPDRVRARARVQRGRRRSATPRSSA